MSAKLLKKNSVSVAIAWNINSTPRKVGLVADLVRGENVYDAMAKLKFCKKKAAGLVLYALRSAIANAVHNSNANEAVLYVQEIFVGKAMMLKRMHARAMGRGARIRKRYTRLTVKLGER